MDNPGFAIMCNKFDLLVFNDFTKQSKIKIFPKIQLLCQGISVNLIITNDLLCIILSPQIHPPFIQMSDLPFSIVKVFLSSVPQASTGAVSVPVSIG